MVLAVVAALGLLTGIPDEPRSILSIPYGMIGMFGSIPIILSAILAHVRPTQDRLLGLSVVGAAIALGAIALCGLLFALFAWASTNEQLREVHTVVQPVPLACAILGSIVAVSSYRAGRP